MKSISKTGDLTDPEKVKKNERMVNEVMKQGMHKKRLSSGHSPHVDAEQDLGSGTIGGKKRDTKRQQKDQIDYN